MNNSGNNHIKIVVRPRFAKLKEKENNNLNDVLINKTNKSIEINREKNEKNIINSLYQFDEVMDIDDDQNVLFNHCDLIDQSILGYNTCIIAYGQTGSGKTYSMFGNRQILKSNSNLSILTRHANTAPDNSTMNSLDQRPKSDSFISNDLLDNEMIDKIYGKVDNGKTNENLDSEVDNQIKDELDISVLSTTDNQMNNLQNSKPGSSQIDTELVTEHDGLIIRSLSNLFLKLNKIVKDKPSSSYIVNCEMIQIYNDKVYDLLQDKLLSNPLQLRESTNGIDVKGLSTYRIFGLSDALGLLMKAQKRRITRATAKNSESTRSHTIVQIKLSIEEDTNELIRTVRHSTLSFIDLSGSEKWSSSLYGDSYNNTYNSGSGNLGKMSRSLKLQSKELTHINSSLHVLGKCISALTSDSSNHIPYRDSQLTRLLQPSLRYGYTLLLTTIRIDDFEETLNTLQFASRARNVKVNISYIQPTNFKDSTKSQTQSVSQLKQQIICLQKQLSEVTEVNNQLNSQLRENNLLKSHVADIENQIYVENRRGNDQDNSNLNSDDNSQEISHLENNQVKNYLDCKECIELRNQIQIMQDQMNSLNYELSQYKLKSYQYAQTQTLKESKDNQIQTYSVSDLLSNQLTNTDTYGTMDLSSSFSSNLSSKMFNVELNYTNTSTNNKLSPNIMSTTDYLSTDLSTYQSPIKALNEQIRKCVKHNLIGCILCNSPVFTSNNPSTFPSDHQSNEFKNQEICTKHGLAQCLLCTMRSNGLMLPTLDHSLPNNKTNSNLQIFDRNLPNVDRYLPKIERSSPKSVTLLEPIDKQLKKEDINNIKSMDEIYNMSTIGRTKKKSKIPKKLNAIVR